MLFMFEMLDRKSKSRFFFTWKTYLRPSGRWTASVMAGMIFSWAYRTLIYWTGWMSVSSGSVSSRRTWSSVFDRWTGTSVSNRRTGSSVSDRRTRTSVSNRRTWSSVSDRRTWTSVSDRWPAEMSNFKNQIIFNFEQFISTSIRLTNFKRMVCNFALTRKSNFTYRVLRGGGE